MTFEKAFDSIKKKFDNASVKDIQDFALQVTMSDEDCGGTFYIAVQNSELDVAPYDYKDNDAVLDITKSDFVALLAGRKSLQKVVENGASLKGDEAVIASVKALAASAKEAPATKAPAKKTAAAKKAPAKKTVAKKAPAKAEVKKTEPVKTAAPAKTAAKATKTTKTTK